MKKYRLLRLPSVLALNRICSLERNTLANSIHPTAQIGKNVVLGDNNHIGAFAVLEGTMTLGNGNWISTGVVLGAPPEVRSLIDDSTRALPDASGLLIGDNNVFREYAQIHQGWKTQTRIGSDCYLMNQIYIAHDCLVGNNVTMASSALLAGHVTVADGANLGMGASVHQGLTVGPGAMVGMGTVVVKSVPLFSKFFGNPGRIRGVNTVGMQRMGISEESIEKVSMFLNQPEETDLFEALKLQKDLQSFL